jgi:hypothetical protein
MKKTLIISALLAGTFSAYSQGQLTYADRQTDMTIHIYAPQTESTGVEITGDANASGGVATDIYANNGVDGNYQGAATQGGTALTGTLTTGGTTVYDGGAIGNTLSSNPTAAGAFHYNNGSDYTVQLWAAPGLNAAASALVPVTQYTTIVSTSSTVGGAFKNVSLAVDPGITGAPSSATIELVAWYNGGGTITSYAQAFLAGDPVGVSPLDNLTGLYTSGAGTPPLPEGLESFSLYIPTPEPSTIALGVIGASTLLFRRRK